MEVAGVVLGTVPLIIYALDSYDKAFDTMKSHYDWQHTIGSIKSRVFLQRKMLVTNIQRIDPRFTEETTIADVEAALRDSQPVHAEEFIAIIKGMEQCMNKIAQTLYPDAQGPPDWTYAKSDRVRWELRRVKRGFQKGKYDSMLQEINTLNIALSNCYLEKREFLRDNDARKINEVQMRYDETATTSIRKNVRLMHRAITSALGCSCTEAHKANLQLDWHEQPRSLAGTTFCLAITAHKGKNSAVNTNPKDEWRALSASIEQSAQRDITAASDLCTTVDCEPPTTNARVPSTAILHDAQENKVRKVVRILGFEISRNDSRKHKSMQVKAAVPVVPVLDENPTVSNAPSPAPDQTLCALLDSMPRNSTLLTSIPVQDLGMCKYICLRPGHQLSRGVSTVPAQFERTVLLPKLLRREVDEVTQKKFCIDWKQQLRLASALVWAVLHLCDSPWLRESLKEDDIHFFLRDDQGANSPVLSLHPYVTHNFCSSPSTTDPPNDQDSMGLQFPSNQIQHIMLFTLAIRLIEIGLNKPFSRLQQKFQNATTTPPNAPQSGPPIASDSPTTTCDDYKIAQLQIDKLGLKMGKFYAGAVESCLRFGSLERVPMNTFENSSFLKTYFDAVVAPIQAIMELRLNM